MIKTIGTALGAGCASAVLFVVSAKGTLPAMVLAYLTPLPIMIGALGFGHSTGFMAAIVAALAIAAAIGPLAAVFFAVALGLPAWWLAYLALLAQPAPADARPAPTADARDKPLHWYPVGRIVTWAAALSAAAVVAVGAAVVLHYSGYQQAITTLSRRLAPEIEAVWEGPSLPGGLTAADLAGALIRLMPPAMACSAFLMLVVNLWLGGRTVALSQRLVRPWPDVPDNLRLPRLAAAAFLVAVGLAFVSGPAGLSAAVMAAALGAAFALQGLATCHVITRGWSARRPILGAIYFVMLLVMPWPLAVMALIGLFDCLFSLRGRKGAPPTAPI